MLMDMLGDIFGRRWAFNLTIGITSIFGLIAAGSPGPARGEAAYCGEVGGAGGSQPDG